MVVLLFTCTGARHKGGHYELVTYGGEAMLPISCSFVRRLDELYRAQLQRM